MRRNFAEFSSETKVRNSFAKLCEFHSHFFCTVLYLTPGHLTDGLTLGYTNRILNMWRDTGLFFNVFFVVVVVPSSVNATELYKIARLSGLNNPMTANGL